MRRLIAITAVAVALPASAHASFPGTNGKIAYEGPGLSGVSTSSIFTMNADGSGKTNLTPNPAKSAARRGGAVGSFDPAYSADGRRIVFERVSQGQSRRDIWVMNADGSGATNITNTATINESDPAFSPDGTKIVFARADDSGTNELWTMNANGADAARLSGTAAVQFPDSPEWSPDGTKIAFEGGTPKVDIHTIGANGQGLANLTSAVTGSNFDPSWSPDATRIAFYNLVQQPQQRSDILTIGADGGATTNLTSQLTGASVESPSFSPDGQLIAYARFDTGSTTGTDVFTMRASDGLQQTNITSDSGASSDDAPNWGPVPVDAPVDSQPPQTSITKEPKDSTKTKAKLKFGSNETGSAFECSLKGQGVDKDLKPFQPCNSGKVKYKNLEVGKKKFRVRAIDAAGNPDPTPAKAKWKVLSKDDD